MSRRDVAPLFAAIVAPTLRKPSSCLQPMGSASPIGQSGPTIPDTGEAHTAYSSYLILFAWKLFAVSCNFGKIVTFLMSVWPSATRLLVRFRGAADAGPNYHPLAHPRNPA